MGGGGAGSGRPRAQRRIKEVFDPHGILNPGKGL
ncbi:FAD-linked oxidase C-terminal domain-containing protein [Streptomyces europaeiscabiei]